MSTTIRLGRGDTGSTKLKLFVSSLEDLPETFIVRFTVKPSLDNDITDSKAIITKSFEFPEDFDLVELVGEDDYYETDLIFTKSDTLVENRTYKWNTRLINDAVGFIRSSSNGDFIITLGTTQSQDD